MNKHDIMILFFCLWRRSLLILVVAVVLFAQGLTTWVEDFMAITKMVATIKPSKCAKLKLAGYDQAKLKLNDDSHSYTGKAPWIRDSQNVLFIAHLSMNNTWRSKLSPKCALTLKLFNVYENHDYCYDMREGGIG